MRNALLKDIRYAVRILLKNRFMTLVAVITLSLGISATVSHFTIGDKVILRPLPFEDLDRLVALRERHLQRGGERYTIAIGDFTDFKSRSAMFENLSGYQWSDFYIAGASGLEKVDGALVSSDFFQTLGVKPAIGRAFSADEGQPGLDRVLILSHGLWQRVFGSDPNILGRAFMINGQERTIVGVMPADFDFPLTAKAWIPFVVKGQDSTRRTDWYLSVVGRLKSGVTVAQAQGEMDMLSTEIEKQNPQTNTGRRARVIPLRVHVRGEFTGMFTALDSLMAVFVLLLCSANVAVLQLASVSARQKELSIRAALGASRWRIVRLLLTESMLLSLVGGSLSILVTYVTVWVIKNRVPPDLARYIPGWYFVAVDGGTLALSLLAALLTCIIFGIAPALLASKLNLSQMLKEDAGSGPSRRRFLKSLVVIEIALAVVILTGGCSLAEGFLRLYSKFDQLSPGNVLTMDISPMQQSYDQNYQVNNSYQGVLRELGGLAEVESVAVAASLPATGRGVSRSISIKGQTGVQPDRLRTCDLQTVSPDYFKTFRIQILKGREFGEQDNDNGQRVAIVSEGLARRYFPNQDPIGQEISITAGASDSPWLSIVGVVSNVNTFWFDLESRATLYVPYRQNPRNAMSLIARTNGDPLAAVTAVVSRIRQVDQKLAVNEVKSMDQVITEHLSGLRIAVDLIILFASVAVLLSAIGVYGMMAFFVTQHTREIGVRLAVGALSRDVYMMVTKRGLALVAIGIGLGLPVALGLSILMSSLLWGAGAFNPVIFVGVAALFIIIGILSTYVPATRASALDPIHALRHE